jgi:hypothetical protein
VHPGPAGKKASMRTAIAVVLALLASFCFALGSLVQQGAARQTHGRALRLGLLVALVRERRWLAGMALTVFSFAIQATALAFGPLARGPGRPAARRGHRGHGDRPAQSFQRRGGRIPPRIRPVKTET